MKFTSKTIDEFLEERAQSYTRKETHFECDYCGNKYGEV